MNIDKDTIKPCAHCGSNWIIMYIDRSHISYLKCDLCTSQVSSDGTHCSDADAGQIIESLVSKWNKRPIDYEG